MARKSGAPATPAVCPLARSWESRGTDNGSRVNREVPARFCERLRVRSLGPTLFHISDGKLHDVNILDQLIPEAGAFYVMDRGYIDFQRLYRLHQAGSFFVTRAKRNMDAQRRYSHPTDRSTGVIYDQTLVLQGYQSAKDYPETFRGIRYKDPETGKRLRFISNNTALP